MTPGRYALAGWLAIAQAVLFFPTIALALFFDRISRRFPGSALLAAHGIVSIVFGRRLLSMKDDLSGLLRPFAHTTVASGALTLTVVGAPVGLALALAAIVMQGMILLRANEDLQYV
jgi:membrane-bound metal-dependent hydrolase YbcI (DUF457 family)